MERVGLLTAPPYQPSDTQHTPPTPEAPSPYSCARSWQSWSSTSRSRLRRRAGRWRGARVASWIRSVWCQLPSARFGIRFRQGLCCLRSRLAVLRCLPFHARTCDGGGGSCGRSLGWKGWNGELGLIFCLGFLGDGHFGVIWTGVWIGLICQLCFWIRESLVFGDLGAFYS